MFDVNSDDVLTFEGKPIRHLKDGATSPLKAVWFTAQDGKLSGKLKKLTDEAANEVERALEAKEAKHEPDGWLYVVRAETVTDIVDAVVHEHDDDDASVKVLESDSTRLITRTRIVSRFEDMSLAQAYRATMKLTLKTLTRKLMSKRVWTVIAWLTFIACAVVKPFETGQVIPFMALMVLMYFMVKGYRRVKLMWLRRRHV